MTREEIVDTAWKELLSGAEGALEDWIDEEGEYGDDAEAIYQKQRELLAELKRKYTA